MTQNGMATSEDHACRSMVTLTIRVRDEVVTGALDSSGVTVALAASRPLGLRSASGPRAAGGLPAASCLLSGGLGEEVEQEVVQLLGGVKWYPVPGSANALVMPGPAHPLD